METRFTIGHMVPAALVAAAANKPIVLKLAWYVQDYKVLAVTNTTVVKPGEWLSVGAVDQINAVPGWTVDIVDNALIQTLFEFGTDAAKGRLP